MTVDLRPADAPRDPQREPPHTTDARSSYDDWCCGLPTDAGPEQRERCQDVLPELIVELL